jgi:hypothetical protein
LRSRLGGRLILRRDGLLRGRLGLGLLELLPGLGDS